MERHKRIMDYSGDFKKVTDDNVCDGRKKRDFFFKVTRDLTSRRARDKAINLTNVIKGRFPRFSILSISRSFYIFIILSHTDSSKENFVEKIYFVALTIFYNIFVPRFFKKYNL